ncbi:zinc finger MYM-type protein 1-like [Athalia rosae]|uniref:zinc finger MYM-type protein 1-like n=1 Tax=Athalia rosae TaxID=37344 RepID=UPI0020346034|nr:zinc finger MYM-type protein 1-like [Athalia rosae]
MRGQGYDNGANMKGKRSGVQSRILKINPRATFVPCSCHSLNLVVNDAASASGETVGFFDIVQQLYVFFSGSTSRWDVLKRHISALTVKAVSATRWESRIDAIKPLRYQLGEVYDALVDISLDENRDKLTQHEAKCLATRIVDFQFICSIIIWYDILSKVNVISKMLQSPKLHLIDCNLLLSEILDFFQQSDGNFLNVIEQARSVAIKVDVEPCFRPATVVRMRRKKKNFDYEAYDEPLIEPQQKFKTEFFNFLIDTATCSIRERFQLLRSHNENFKFLYNIRELKNSNGSGTLQQCKNLQLFLTDGNSTDIDALELWDELKNLSTLLPSELTPLQVLNYLKENDVTTIFPNLVIALRILLTLPVSVASGERSFSKLKMIKNYLRSTMSQERLVGLATISIESEICESLNYNDLISEFAQIKARKVRFE